MRTSLCTRNTSAREQVLHKEKGWVKENKETASGTGEGRFRELLAFFEEAPHQNPNLKRQSSSGILSAEKGSLALNKDNPTGKLQARNSFQTGKPYVHILGNSPHYASFRAFARTPDNHDIKQNVHCDSIEGLLGKVPKMAAAAKNIPCTPGKSSKEFLTGVKSSRSPFSSSESSGNTLPDSNLVILPADNENRRGRKVISAKADMEASSRNRCSSGLKRVAHRIQSLGKALYCKLKAAMIPKSRERSSSGNDVPPGGISNVTHLLNVTKRGRVLLEKNNPESYSLRSPDRKIASHKETSLHAEDSKAVHEGISEKQVSASTQEANSKEASAQNATRISPVSSPGMVTQENLETNRFTPLPSIGNPKSLLLARDDSSFTEERPFSSDRTFEMPTRASSSASNGTRRVFSMTSNVSVYTGANIEEAAMNINVDDGTEGVLDEATRSLRFTSAGTVVDSLYGNLGFRKPAEVV